MVEIQGEPGQDVLDEVLTYRFWLSPAEPRTDLVAANRSDREARLVAVHFSPGGATQTLAKVSVLPRGTFELPAAELLRANVESFLVKAPRRLELFLVRESGKDSLIRIVPHPNAVFYDVFSASRQFDVEQEAQRRLAERVERGQRMMLPLGEQQAATEEAALKRRGLRLNAEQSGEHYFISYWVK